MGVSGLSGLRVLVVEDEYLIATDLKQVLHDRGASAVRLSADLHDAIRQVHTGKFEIAVVDVNIHGTAAYPVADEMERRGLPFAFLTGYDRAVIPDRFAGHPVWCKPFDAGQIADKIHQLWKSA